jgi:FixJ family two-component response regulator
VSIDHPVIAVVDDDPSVRVGVQRLLRSAGMSVATFDSGPAFLASLEKTPPDCVVLDIRMPVMSGSDVEDGMREMGCTAPVIFISADERGYRNPGATRARGYAFLCKPFDGDQLLAAIESALTGRSADRT